MKRISGPGANNEYFICISFITCSKSFLLSSIDFVRPSNFKPILNNLDECSRADIDVISNAWNAIIDPLLFNSCCNKSISYFNSSNDILFGLIGSLANLKLALYCLYFSTYLIFSTLASGPSFSIWACPFFCSFLAFFFFFFFCFFFFFWFFFFFCSFLAFFFSLFFLLTLRILLSSFSNIFNCFS